MLIKISITIIRKISKANNCTILSLKEIPRYLFKVTKTAVMLKNKQNIENISWVIRSNNYYVNCQA